MVLKQKIKKKYWEDKNITEIGDMWCKGVLVWHINRVLALMVVTYFQDVETNRYFLWMSLAFDLHLLQAMYDQQNKFGPPWSNEKP